MDAVLGSFGAAVTVIQLVEQASQRLLQAKRNRRLCDQLQRYLGILRQQLRPIQRDQLPPSAFTAYQAISSKHMDGSD